MLAGELGLEQGLDGGGDMQRTVTEVSLIALCQVIHGTLKEVQPAADHGPVDVGHPARLPSYGS